MKIRPFSLVGAMALCWLAGHITLNAATPELDLEAPVFARLGAPRNLEQSPDQKIFYSCRFLLSTRNILLTMHAYTIERRSDLATGNKVETESGPVFQLGLRPSIIRWQIELRRLVNNVVVVSTCELVGKEAQEMDRFLVCNEIFSLQPVEPWLLINGNGSDALLAELLIDGRAVAVRRYTEDSSPAKGVADRLTALASEMEKAEPTK